MASGEVGELVPEALFVGRGGEPVAEVVALEDGGEIGDEAALGLLAQAVADRRRGAGVEESDEWRRLARRGELARHLEGDVAAEGVAAQPVGRARGPGGADGGEVGRGHVLDALVGLLAAPRVRPLEAIERLAGPQAAGEVEVAEDRAARGVDADERRPPPSLAFRPQGDERRAPVRRGPGAGPGEQQSGEPRDREAGEERVERQRDAVAALEEGEQLDRRHRLAAEVEEVVLPADRLDRQQPPPVGRELRLERRARRQGPRSVGTCGRWRGHGPRRCRPARRRRGVRILPAAPGGAEPRPPSAPPPPSACAWLPRSGSGLPTHDAEDQ